MKFSLPPKPNYKNIRKGIRKQMIAEIDRRKTIPAIASNLAAEICAKFSPKKESPALTPETLGKAFDELAKNNPRGLT